MMKLLGILILIGFGNVCCQTVVNRVYLVNSRQYMVDVIQEVMNTVEQQGWWNLLLSDIKYDIEETIFNKNYTGTVTYKNGFLISIQQLDVLSSSLSQIWNVTEGQVRVHFRGRLRMTDVTLGYDVEAELEDGMHHYTGSITHPLMTYDFWVVSVPETHEMWVKVFGELMTPGNIINLLPRDHTSDALTTLFQVRDTQAGMVSWTEVFKPITEDVVSHRIKYPDMCYNCPLTVQ